MTAKHKRRHAPKTWNFESDRALAEISVEEIIDSILAACNSVDMSMDDTVDISRACAEELKRRRQSPSQSQESA